MAGGKKFKFDNAELKAVLGCQKGLKIDQALLAKSTEHRASLTRRCATC
jgi:hypothetical protein